MTRREESELTRLRAFSALLTLISLISAAAAVRQTLVFPQPGAVARSEASAERGPSRDDSRPCPDQPGSRQIRQGEPAGSGASPGSRINRACDRASSVSSDESCIGAGVATSRPSGSFASVARM